MKTENNLFKNHIDTMVIVGVNIAIAAILIAIFLSNISNISYGPLMELLQVFTIVVFNVSILGLLISILVCRKGKREDRKK